jgi:hypothetical protein
MVQKTISEHSPTLTLAIALGFALITSPAVGQPIVCTPHGRTTLEREQDPLKNREDAPPADQIDRSATLEAVLAPGPDLDRWSHDHGAVFEGIVVLVKHGGKESANCGAIDLSHEDTHIELAPSPSAPKNQHVVVEVTPRIREKMAVIADWSTPTLKSKLTGRRVRITGWLFDDLIHKGAAENTHPRGLDNWRATVWEIHPITAIQVLPGPAVAIPSSEITWRVVRHSKPSPKRKCTRSRGQVCRRTVHKRTGISK